MCSIRETISLRTPHVFLYRSFEKHAQHFADCLRRLRWIGSTSVCTRRWLCDVVWQLVCVSCSLTPRGLQGHLSCGMQIAGLTLFNGFNGGTHFYTFEIAHAGQYTIYTCTNKTDFASGEGDSVLTIYSYTASDLSDGAFVQRNDDNCGSQSQGRYYSSITRQL
eukprot:m.898770 g.898770  ORF g.898770 m.898770 type:complete len:164 (-) comp23675_c0_seq13:287-778(-)